MRTRFLPAVTAAFLLATAGVWGQTAQTTAEPPAQEPQRGGPVFRSVSNLILVDV